MKNKINYIITALMIALTILCLPKHNVEATSTGIDYVERLGSGINLGNTFETGLEDMVLDEKSTTAIVDNVRSQGFSSIRIPVTWQGHWEEDSNVIDKEYLAKIKRFVDAAISKKMNVILTMYDDSWKWINDTKNVDETMKVYRFLWKQIAEYFREYNDQLCFEAVNAPIFSDISIKEQLNVLSNYNKNFISVVRGAGGKNKERYLLLPLLNGQVNEDNCKSMVSALKDLKDSRIIVSAQYYGLWSFSVNAADSTTFNQSSRQHMQYFFECIDTYFNKNKIPVVCVEYGLYGYPAYNNAIIRGERLKYFYQFVNKAYKAKLSFFLWDTGVIYNRITNQWDDLDLAYILKNYKRNNYSYGSSDAIYIVEDKPIKDITLAFTLNSGKLGTPVYNKKSLRKNLDYTVTDNKITIKKSFLKSLQATANGVLGTIGIAFSSGPSWNISLIKVGKPSFKKDGTKEASWNIPMQDQGDAVISMEAFTKNKKPVGPLDWTTYQEYGYSFLPDYENHSLNLTEEFLAFLPEKKEIVLRFHFRSGQVLDYSIIKEKEGIREITFDLDKKSVNSAMPNKAPDIKHLVEEENQAVVLREAAKNQAMSLEKNSSNQWDDLGWKLMFISFAVMVVLGFAIFYIYQVQRNENLDNILEETEDLVEQKIYKILVDKTRKDA